VSDEDIPTPSLIREARGAYGLAVRGALTKIGLGHLPRNSAYVLGAMDAFGMSFDDVVHHRRKSLEQSRTVEVLFKSGCLETKGALTVLTDRGREAAKACAEARAMLDDEIIARIGTEGFATMRAGLVALIDWKEGTEQR
jgi:predicted NBD/HSP70 family sugar kinase